MSPSTRNVIILSIDSLNFRAFEEYFGGVRSVLDGVNFTNAVSTASNTNSSVPTLAAGVYADAITDVGLPVEGPPTPVAELLADSGYQCGLWTDNFLFGKEYNYHRGFSGGNVGRISWKRQVADYLERQPFDALYDFSEWFYFNVFSDVLTAVSDDSGSFWKSARSLNESLLAWLRANEETPSFAWVHYMDTHHPYEPPPTYFEDLQLNGRWTRGELAKFSREVVKSDGKDYTESELEDIRAAYRGCCRSLASELETLVTRLLEEGLFVLGEDLLIVTADHGESLYPERHGQMGHQSCWEDTVHVPLYVSHPEWEPATVSTQVSLIDMMPTVLQFAGASVPSSVAGRGWSTTEPFGTEEALFVNAQPWYRTRRGIRTDTGWKLFGHKSRDNSHEVVLTRYAPEADENEEIVHRTPVENPSEPPVKTHRDRWRDLSRRLNERIGPPVGDNADFTLTDDLEDHLEQLGYLE